MKPPFLNYPQYATHALVVSFLDMTEQRHEQEGTTYASVLSIITGLSRPRLLVSAARFGIDNYRRSTQLPRLLGCSAAPRTGPAAMQLVSIEADLNEKRRNNAADYSVARHVDILIALMAEAQLIRASATTLQGIT